MKPLTSFPGKLFTLVAGYIAGLAVAMKYRKDSGASKFNDTSANKSQLDAFIDEVVDIHKTAFTDIKGFAKENFDDINDFDALKSKVSEMISGFSSSLETQIESAKKSGISRGDELLKIAETLYLKNELLLEKAKAKAVSFVGISESTINSWIENAHHELKSAYQTIESHFAENNSEHSSNKKTGSKKDSQ